MKKINNTLRKSVLTALGLSVTLIYSGHAAAISPASLPVLTAGAVNTVTGNTAKRAWSD